MAETIENGLNLTFGIPARNERPNIESAIEEALTEGRASGGTFEVLVVDDASSDGTDAILRGLALRHSEVRVIRRSGSRGIGAAIGLLCAEARGDLVFLNAADGQWRMSELHPMLSAMRAGSFDLVVGARIRKRYTPYRRLVSIAYRVFCEQVFGYRVWDPGSIILMRRSVARLEVQSIGVFAHAERIIRAQALGFRAGKVDVEHLARTRGTGSGASLSNVILAVREGARFYFGRVVPRRKNDEE